MDRSGPRSDAFLLPFPVVKHCPARGASACQVFPGLGYRNRGSGFPKIRPRSPQVAQSRSSWRPRLLPSVDRRRAEYRHRPCPTSPQPGLSTRAPGPLSGGTHMSSFGAARCPGAGRRPVRDAGGRLRSLARPSRLSGPVAQTAKPAAAPARQPPPRSSRSWPSSSKQGQGELLGPLRSGRPVLGAQDQVTGPSAARPYTTASRRPQRKPGDIREVLEDEDAAYQTFWATNAIRVKGGDSGAGAEDRPPLGGRGALYASFDYKLEEPIKGKTVHESTPSSGASPTSTPTTSGASSATAARASTVGQHRHRRAVRPPGAGQAVPRQQRRRHVQPQLQLVRRGRHSRPPATTTATAPTRWAPWSATTAAPTRSAWRPAPSGSRQRLLPLRRGPDRLGQWMLAPTDLAARTPTSASARTSSTTPGARAVQQRPVHGGHRAGLGRGRDLRQWSNGNSGPDCQTSGSPGSRIINYSAGAYDINNAIAGFSSRGAGQDGEIKPNISAPGVNVRSSFPATPTALQRYVDGVAAPRRRGRAAVVGGTVAAR